ncbi:hypothetical protein [Clavibacter sp. VKM Ac-2872]|uniref:hypothetical protein n=1 Tax=Clavibacter sp. VKM Ac-2872 TaxID=2783812 RepID=UPI00188D089B|nr:hypothetical protein [Clavibacter sp. VKM Ac-2872]MBF4622784.1 hypothetical protein [Clavibacter sp. VKM Ac-2872]
MFLVFAISAGVSAVETRGSILAQPPVLGTIAVIASALAYLGVWRGWARTPVPALGTLPFLFGLGFFGAGLLLVSLPIHLPFPANRIFGDFILDIMFVSMVGMVGMLWLPRFRLPRWFKEEHGLMRKKLSPAEGDAGEAGDQVGSRESDLMAHLLTSRDPGPDDARQALRHVPRSRGPGDTTLISGYLGGAIDGHRVGALSADLGAGSGEMLATAFGPGPEGDHPRAGRSGRHVD